MRKFLIAALAVLAMDLSSGPLLAAPGGALPVVMPLTQRVQGNYYGNYGYGFGFGYGYDYKPACPTNYHYDCWHDPYGYRHCGCVLNRW
jgi:hypothetical protein